MVSGSCRKMARRQPAKVTPTSVSIGIWIIPSMSYSTGSSVVISLSLILLSSVNDEYRVVVLPLPVGPVTSTIPLGRSMAARNFDIMSSSMPTFSRLRLTTLRSSTRMTTHSPKMVGSTLTRKSTACPPTISSIRPSWGMRRSAMSRLAITLIRVVMANAR